MVGSNPVTEILFLGLKANYRFYRMKSQVFDFLDELGVLSSSSSASYTKSLTGRTSGSSSIIKASDQSASVGGSKTDRRAARIERMKQNRAAAAAGRREGSPDVVGTHGFLGDLHTTPASLLPRELQEEKPISAGEMAALEAQLDQLQEEVAQVGATGSSSETASPTLLRGAARETQQQQLGTTQPAKVKKASHPIYSYLEEDFLSPTVAAQEGKISTSTEEETGVLSMTIPQYIQSSGPDGVVLATSSSTHCSSTGIDGNVSSSCLTATLPSNRCFGSSLGTNNNPTAPMSSTTTSVTAATRGCRGFQRLSSTRSSAIDTENIAVALIERFGR